MPAVWVAGPVRNCLKKEWVLPFLEMLCNISETTYFNSSTLSLLARHLPAGRQGRGESKPVCRQAEMREKGGIYE